MKYFIIIAVLSGISFGIKAQKLSDLEKMLQLERSRRFPYCGKLNLSQNFPNPIKQNESSMINYRAIDATFVEIAVYDSLGEIVFINKVEPGVGEFEIHASQLKPGRYYYALIVNGRRMFKKELNVAES